MKLILTCLSALAVMVALASAAFGDATLFQAFPTDLNGPIIVRAEATGSGQRFTVFYRTNDTATDEFMGGTLEVRDEDNQIAKCEIAKRWTKGGLEFAFEVAPPFLEASKFTIVESAHDGRRPMPGFYCVWFYLRDFATNIAPATAPSNPGFVPVGILKDLTKKGTNMIPMAYIEDDLRQNAAKVGCHLTLEYQGMGATDDGEGAKVPEPSPNTFDADSIPSFLSKLRSFLDDYTVVQDAKNPKIVHIIQTILAEDGNYVLNKRTSLNYAGNFNSADVPIVPTPTNGRWNMRVGGLILTLADKIHGGIMEGTEENKLMGPDPDAAMRVNVQATNETVRSILTDCLPAANDDAILWRAVPTTVAGTNTVLIQFFGQKK